MEEDWQIDGQEERQNGVWIGRQTGKSTREAKGYAVRRSGRRTDRVAQKKNCRVFYLVDSSSGTPVIKYIFTSTDKHMDAWTVCLLCVRGQSENQMCKLAA